MPVHPMQTIHISSIRDCQTISARLVRRGVSFTCHAMGQEGRYFSFTTDIDLERGTLLKGIPFTPVRKANPP
jgi:hypothetical protein